MMRKGTPVKALVNLDGATTLVDAYVEEAKKHPETRRPRAYVVRDLEGTRHTVAAHTDYVYRRTV